MEIWFFIVITVCTAAILKSILTGAKPRLPPGPFTIPFITTLSLYRKSFADVEAILRRLNKKLGPIVAVTLGRRPAVFVFSRSLAHQALIQNGAVFADRPPPFPVVADQLNVTSGWYGPTWRALRRNLTAEILNPSRVRSYGRARRWVLEVLLGRVKSDEGTVVQVAEHFQYAMFCLLVLMCFGDRLEEEKIKEVEKVQRAWLLTAGRSNILNLLPPWLGKVVFRRRWEEFQQLRRNQAAVLLPMIRARSEARDKARKENEDVNERDNIKPVICYVDTLLNLQLPDDHNRSLTEDEILTLSSEFLNAGTDTTSTALEWIMANLVKYPRIQTRIYDEIKASIPSLGFSDVLKEEDLHNLTYLKAVVLEGLRRHPPGHFLLPHAVTEDTELGGYTVPKNGWVNFMVADMGLDPTAWDDPMEFKPERFFNSRGDGIDSGFDIKGIREIKMMPFGVGRRMCPAYNLALLHLEFFVANLVWAFEWRPAQGDDVDLSEKQDFTVVMKNPLKAVVRPRVKA